MSTFLEILLTAAALQLLVLPGEKGQLVIAGLATKYSPWSVGAGASVAFAGWTALEVAFGDALKGALPTVYLDVVTGGLFLLFAALLVRAGLELDGTDSASGDGDGDVATDGGQVTSGVTGLDRYLPDDAEGFFPAFSATAFGEFGDKTQLVTISLAVQYGARPAIWIGVMLVIVPISLLTAFVFDRGVTRLNPTRRRWLYFASALVFVLFAADLVAGALFGVSLTPV